MVDMARVWPIFCQSGVGAVLCFIGIWTGYRSGYLDMHNRDDRRAIGIIIAGFLGLLILFCLFTFWLPYVGSDMGGVQ